jgi:aspartate-semialdehyde dehydrogenase
MAIPLESRRLVIAGASSLLGAELKSLLEESRFAASDFRLVDEEAVAGTLTEAGGEAAVIQPVEEDSFNKAWVVFFTGSAAFTTRNLELAKKSGARIVDLSGACAGCTDAQAWLPTFESGAVRAPQNDDRILLVPSAPVEIVARLAVALRSLQLKAMTAVAFQPVSASGGKAGIEELELQTGQLLSFQPLGKQVFDTQVAFAMLDRFGAASRQRLEGSLEILRRELLCCLPKETASPALELLHAPMYYGTAVSACAFLGAERDRATMMKACASAGFSITSEDDAPSNVTSAGETSLQLAPPRADASATNAWWFWGAADNLRLPAANAVKLAEKLLE